MEIIVAGLLLLVATGVLSAFLQKWPRISSSVGMAGPLAFFALSVGPMVSAFLGGGEHRWDMSWNVPLGSLSLGLDPLSAFFALTISGLSAASSVYGFEYLHPYEGKRATGMSWFFFNALTASMIVLCLARNVLLFLVGWESMALTSFFLVAFESEREDARRAAWIYLVASQLGTACLFAMFLLMGGGKPLADFALLGKDLSPFTASLCFVLALVGFGTKAGIFPVHVWLPEAHPAAPSHVSALMSGVMIKTGIYGLMRVLTLLGNPPVWWGWVLIFAGALSGVLGVLYAISQHDIKRLLAYHSVENIGIILLGIGVGTLGMSMNSPALCVLGFGGGLLHVVNHALFKGLLFLGAGSVIHATEIRDMDHMGGLLKKMPWTGATFLLGAAAISGLPPLNGFVSEFLIYLGAFMGVLSATQADATPFVLVIAALAIIGGLAAACFSKAVGIIFLGEPRGPRAAEAHEAGIMMIVPMLVLASCCAMIGLLGFKIVKVLAPLIENITGLSRSIFELEIAKASQILQWVSIAGLLFLGLTAFFFLLRRFLLRGRQVTETGTWDCGYAAPSARMQYSSSSFAQPLTHFFYTILRTSKHLEKPAGYFPARASIETHTADGCQRYVYEPLFSSVNRVLSKLLVLQHGRIQLYILYVIATLIVLLMWKM
jgi:hydrogenase-4 component B